MKLGTGFAVFDRPYSAWSQQDWAVAYWLTTELGSSPSVN